MSLLSVQGLGKCFTMHHLERSVVAFEGVSFTLEPGEFRLVRGPNGAGKSSLLRCLYRSYRPTAGRALYRSLLGPVDLAVAADEDVMLLRRAELGYVSQFLRPRPRVSALELVAEPLARTGLSREAARLEAGAALEALGLRPELWLAYPSTFSGGEQQKVNLARALVRPPRLLLLDEPTASLDAGARTALAGRLGQLRAAGVAILGVLHHPGDVAGLVDGQVDISGELAAIEPEREVAYVAD